MEQPPIKDIVEVGEAIRLAIKSHPSMNPNRIDEGWLSAMLLDCLEAANKLISRAGS